MLWNKVLTNYIIDYKQPAIAHGALGTLPHMKCAMHVGLQHLKVLSFLEIDLYSPMKHLKGLLVLKMMLKRNFNVVPKILRMKPAKWVHRLNESWMLIYLLYKNIDWFPL